MSDSKSHVSVVDTSAVTTEFELKQQELRLREAELAIRQRELDAMAQSNDAVSQGKAARTSSPATVAIATALFGLLGTGVGAILQGYWNTRLERQKFEAALIQNALASGDQQDIAQSLQFLVEIGLIQSLNAQKIEKAASRPAQLPDSFGGGSASIPPKPVASKNRPASSHASKGAKSDTDASVAALNDFVASTTSVTSALPSATSTGTTPAVAADDPSPKLSRNAEAKMRLKKLGMFSGPIDDNPTPELSVAVRQFQKQRDMPEDGLLGVKTFAELRAATPD